MGDADSSLSFIPGGTMIFMKFGDTFVEDAQTIDHVAAIMREHPASMSAKTQVSGHEFTRAVPKKNLGFSPCQKIFQGLKAKLLLPYTARLKSCPDTCLIRNKAVLFNSALHGFFFAPPRLRGGFAFLRASVSPWWIFCEVHP